ncbi:MAG: sugar ABC transporter permease [Bacillota bacterium]|nr:sugar ABC transporter permease [Bacillota bacterium]
MEGRPATGARLRAQRAYAAASPWNADRLQETATGYLFVLPVLAVYAVFTVGPAVWAAILSFQDYNLIGGFRGWVGAGNYVRMLRDPVFVKALLNTVYYVLGVVPTQTFIALVMAVVLNMELRGRSVFRTLYYLPSVTSSVVISLLFLQILSEQGLLNAALRALGFHPPNWLQNTALALPSIMAVNVWTTVGTMMILYLAALQNIPTELYEAAEIDGASPWQQLWHVTVPQLRNATFFVVTNGIIGCFQVFDQMFIMTDGNGGPLNSTMTLMLYIYKNAFGGYNAMGYAAAISFALFAMILVIVIVQRRLFREEAA